MRYKIKKHEESQFLIDVVNKINTQNITREDIVCDIRCQVRMLLSTLDEETTIDKLNEKIARLNIIEIIELIVKLSEATSAIDKFVARLDKY